MAQSPIAPADQTFQAQPLLAPQAPPPLQPEETGGFNLQNLWRAIRRRQRLVLLVAGLTATASFAAVVHKRITAPVYSGGFELLISDPISAGSSSGGDASGGGGGGVVESLARNRTSVDVPTLIKTLSSPVVLDPVRLELGTAAKTLDSLSISQSGDSRSGGGLQGVLAVSLSGEVPAQVQRSLTALSNTYLNFALAQRRDRLTQGLRFLDAQEPVLQAKVNRLQLELAAFRRTHNLLAPEAEAAALKGEVMGMGTQERSLAAERARLLKLRAEIASGRLTAANFSSGGSSSANGSSAGANPDSVSVTQARSDLLDQLQSVEQQLAQARATYRSDSARIQALVALRNRLAEQRRSQQLTAVDTALSLNTTKNTTLQRQIRGLDQEFLRQPALIKEFEDIQQRLTVAQTNLANFLSTRATFQLEQAQNTTPWRVITPPSVKGYPEEPNLRKGLINALLLGLAAGVGAGLLRDRLDHVFHNPSEVQDDLQEPLLGHIPHVSFFKGVREDKRFLLAELDQASSRSPDGAAPGDLPKISGYLRFFYQEAFRNLFTSLRFLNADRPLRSIALTSSLPAEGKTLVNVLLAKTLAEMGQRVLLVDADLRKPQMHHRLGLNNLTGLSNLLTEPDLHWSDAIQPVAGYEGWSVLTAGRRPPDPARLLSSDHMRHLVQELAASDQFDLVLFDTPPVLGLADAALVAQHLDGLMLLVSLQRVDRTLPREAADRIRSSGASLLGVITNAVREEEQHRGGYGYGRYGYGRYGYGRYGYGRYGYSGYGSYDYRNTYSYYNNDAPSPAEADRAAAEASKPLPALVSRLRRASDAARRWIDG